MVRKRHNHSSSKHFSTLDPSLVQKVRNIVEEKQSYNPNAFIDVDEVVESLQNTFPVYRRTKKPSLSFSVSKALEKLRLEALWEEQGNESENTFENNEKSNPSPSNEILSITMEEDTKVGPTSPPSISPSPKRKVSSTEPSENGSEEKPKKKRKKLNFAAIDTKVGEKSPSIFQPTPVPTSGYEILGGLNDIIEQVKQLIELPLLCPILYEELGVSPIKGILLHGPPGCGKTLLANCIAAELGRKIKKFSYFRISAPEIISGMSGESESNIRNLFNMAKNLEPSLIFIDEIDVICPKRDSASKEMERRIVAQLVTSFNELRQKSEVSGTLTRVVVIGATNRLDSLDPSLRVGGRFDKEIALKVPDEAARTQILKIQCCKMKLSQNFDFVSIARQTPGFVGADLVGLASEAASLAVKRIIDEFHIISEHSNRLEIKESNSLEENSEPSEFIQPIIDLEKLKSIYITMEDFEKAVKKIQPSAKREGFATIPNVKWEDIGALEDIRSELNLHLLKPIKQPWKFKQVGLDIPVGILLYGPPGCGKTLLAKAIANDCSSSFISVKGPELLNKYVGESERAVRKVFERAKHSLPCVIFFDEIDALCPRRDDDESSVTKRVVNQLLTEIDGLEERKGIFIIAATNRPDIIDPAMLRHERLGKLLYVPLPDEPSRLKILQTLTRKINVDPNLNLPNFASLTKRFSGADLAALVREAAVIAISKCSFSEEEADQPVIIQNQDFEEAFEKVSPSVSEEDEKKYLKLKARFKKIQRE